MGSDVSSMVASPAYGVAVTESSGKYDCMDHSTSSAVRGHHTASSNPKSTGLRLSGSLPRCHLPHIPVAYPASDSAWALVTSHRVSPSGGSTATADRKSVV